MASAGRSEGSVMANCNGTPINPTCLGRRQVGRSTRWNCRPRAERPSGSICGPPMRPCRGSFARIAGKRAIFDYARRLEGYGRDTDKHVSEEVRRLTPPVTHALVRAYPETGDRSLYLDSTTTVG